MSEMAASSPSRRVGSDRRRIRHRADDLDRQSWLAFLDTLTESCARARLRIDGVPIADSDYRAVHRWRVEGHSPSLWRADEFCVAYGLHIDEFFAFCQLEHRQPWACGQPPAWLSDPLAARSRPAGSGRARGREAGRRRP